jgi:hypothetical protein
MQKSSTKSTIVAFRLKNDCRDKIEQALKCPTNHNTSVSDYCREVIERYAFRHERKV